MKTYGLSWIALFLTSCLAHSVNLNSGQTPTGLSTPKIDTHSHVYPDFYRDAVIAAGQVPGPDGNAAPPSWNISMHLAFMASNNIEKSFISVSSPGTNLYPNNLSANLQLTQRMNNFTADLKRQYPDKFGFFASLPLLSINETLAEIDRALDVLNADGFVFLSNAFGLYGGDPALKPVYEKLDARKAVIFIHPTAPCPKNAPAAITGTARLDYVAPLMYAYQAPMLEFIFDTTRTVVDLILTGTAQTYSNVKWIVPHCGSVIPAVLDRCVSITSLLGAKVGSNRPAVPYTFANATALLQRQFWFDLAGFPMTSQIFSMHRMFGPDKFLYGSDVPFTAPAGAKGLIGVLNATLPNIFNDTEIAQMFKGNADELLA